MRMGRWGSFWQTPELTDPDGRFVLEDLQEGKHTLRAHRKGGGEAILEHFEIGIVEAGIDEPRGAAFRRLFAPGGIVEEIAPFGNLAVVSARHVPPKRPVATAWIENSTARFVPLHNR